MHQIPVNSLKEDVQRQYAFLKRYENSFRAPLHKKIALIFIILAFVVIGIFILTPANSLVTIKALSFTFLSIMSGCLVIYSSWYLIKISKRNSLLEKLINANFKTNVQYFLEFDDENITYITQDSKTSHKWTYYKGYLEDTSAVFLFNSRWIYSCVFFTSIEIGTDNLERLKEIVKMKIPKLDLKNIR